MWDPHPRPVLSTTTTTTTTTKKLKCIVLGGAGAGKTSILRRYFHNQFDFHRMPTLGSDFYTRKILEPQTGLGGEEKKEPSSPSAQKRMLSMQVWDTPGRERFSNRKPMYTAAFSDNFFKEIDAALLVYDITSSTSFTHVLKWHADLMERIRRLEAAPFPVIIVANKMDIFDQQHVHKSQKKAIVAQRDVMGLAETFRGKDSPYEYSANHPTKVISSSSLSSSFAIAESSSNKQHHHHHNRGKHRHEISTYMGTGDQTSYLEAVLNNEVVRGSYLESLLSTEDGSHPDKDMVLLWTMRNGLKHMEVSALDGTGIDELINEMVKLALESSLSSSRSASSKQQQHTQQSTTTQASETVAQYAQRNDELDLFRRYAPEARSFCFQLPFGFNFFCFPFKRRTRVSTS